MAAMLAARGAVASRAPVLPLAPALRALDGTRARLQPPDAHRPDVHASSDAPCEALAPMALLLLQRCAASIADDAGGAARVADVSGASDAQGAGHALLAAAIERDDLHRTGRIVAWVGQLALDGDLHRADRLQRAAWLASRGGVAVVVTRAAAGRLPSLALVESHVRRHGWRHLQYWVDASARHAVHVLERLPA